MVAMHGTCGRPGRIWVRSVTDEAISLSLAVSLREVFRRGAEGLSVFRPFRLFRPGRRYGARIEP
jgi:hypothetical protein